jgi:hypothetical protein
LHAVTEPPLHEQSGHVCLHCCLGDDELCSDLGVGQAFGDEAENVELSAGQLVEPGRRRR